MTRSRSVLPLALSFLLSFSVAAASADAAESAAPPKPAAAPAAAAAPHGAPFQMESYQLVLLWRGAAVMKEDAPALVKLQEQHLAHLGKMGASGKMVVAGPLGDQPDERLRGICLYRVGSLAEARALAEADPMVQAGRLRVEVMTWFTEKGALAFPRLGLPLGAKQN